MPHEAWGKRELRLTCPNLKCGIAFPLGALLKISFGMLCVKSMVLYKFNLYNVQN